MQYKQLYNAMLASDADTRIAVARAGVVLAAPITMIVVALTVKHLCDLDNAVAQTVVD